MRKIAVGLARSTFTSEARTVRSRGDLITAIAVAGFLVVAPLFFTFHGGQDDAVEFFSVRMPSTCMTERLFHFQCPGCGLMRSFILIAHGHVIESLAFHRLAIVLYAFFLCQVFASALRLTGRRPRLGEALARIRDAAAPVLIALLLVNWAIGIFIGSN